MTQTDARPYPAENPVVRDHFDPTFSLAAVQAKRVRYADTRVSTCDEVAFESFWDYAAWQEAYRIEQSDPVVALQAAFRDLFDANGVSTMRDTTNTPLPPPDFIGVFEPLSDWDRGSSRASTYSQLINSSTTAAWHLQRWNVAQQQGWSVEWLEELRRRIQVFERAVGRWQVLNRQLVDELIRDKAALEGRLWEDARLDIAIMFGPDRFARWLAQMEGYASPRSPVDYLRGLDRDWTMAWDVVNEPVGGWSDDITRQQIESVEPPEHRLGELPNPDYGLTGTLPPLLDVHGLARQQPISGDPYGDFETFAMSYARPGSRLEALLAQVIPDIQVLAAEIDAYYDELEPICSQTPNPCEWAPSMFLERLEHVYESRRTGTYKTCLDTTGNVFDQALIFQRRFSQPFIPDDFDGTSRPGSSHYDRDYASSLASYRTLAPALAAYEQLREDYFAHHQREVVLELRDDYSMDAGSGKPRMSASHTKEKMIGGDWFGGTIRAQSRSGMSTDIENASGQVVDGGFCEPGPEADSDFEFSASIVGNRFRIFAAHNDLGIRSTTQGTYAPRGDGLLSILGFVGFSFDYRNGIPTAGVKLVPQDILDRAKITFVKSPPAVIMVGPVPVSLEAGVVGKLKAHVEVKFSLSPQLNVCNSGTQRNFWVDVSGGYEIEGFAEAAISAGILQIGVRGSLVLLGVTAKLGMDNAFEPGDLWQQSDSFLEFYQCDRMTRTCNGPPHPGPLIDQTLKTKLTFDFELFAGRISVFAEVDFGVFTEGVELDLVRWAGARGRLQPFEEENRVTVNSDFWTNPCIFGTGDCDL